jgi:hypothetical protein
MPEPAGLIEHLKEKQPATWALLKRVALDGLVVIDEETDAVTGANRLLLTYPALHEILSTLTNAWAERRSDTRAHFARLDPGTCRRIQCRFARSGVGTT